MTETTETATPLWERLRDASQVATNSRRAFTEFALKNFEQTVDNIVEYEKKAAEPIPFEWLKEAVVVRAALLNEFKTAYVRAARAMLL